LSSHLDAAKRPLVVLSAWEMKPALEEIAVRYEADTGRRVDLRFGTSRMLLAQLTLAEQGDLFICASKREQDTAVEEGLVTKWSERPLAYLVPAMIVRRDARVDIRWLSDIVSEDARLVIADPEHEPMGRVAAELVEAAGFGKQARALVAATPPSAPEAVELVSLAKADVAIAWRVMQQWEPDFLQVVEFDPEEITRVALVTIGKTRFCRDDEAANSFVKFLAGNDAQGALQKWRYITTRADAMKAAPEATLGGEPDLPPRWRAGAQNNNPGVDE
jgi:molybdate transport system substrate-binding protein